MMKLDIGVLAYYRNDDIKIVKELAPDSDSYGYEAFKKFDNDDITNYCEIPVIARCRALRIQKNGKYFIEYFYAGGLGDKKTLEKAIQTSRAQTLIKQNREKNEATKNQIEEEINNVVIIDDVEEPEIIEQPEEIKTQEDQQNINFKKIFDKYRDLIVLGTIGLMIFICIIILFIKLLRKNKGGKEIGEKKEN